MLITGLVVGTLTARARAQTELARERERSTSALYAMARELSAARDRDDVVTAATRHVGVTFAGDAAVLLPRSRASCSPSRAWATGWWRRSEGVRTLFRRGKGS